MSTEPREPLAGAAMDDSAGNAVAERAAAGYRPPPTLVSVIIPARNAAHTIGAQLTALAGQRYDGPWEVVVVDNGSTDGTSAVATSFANSLPSLRIVTASERFGTNVARNAGVADARGDLLVFCDADDVVAPGWLAAMVDAARGADLLGGTFDDDTLNPAHLRRWRPYPFPQNRLPQMLGFLPFAVSANCAVWADALEVVGGWDESWHVCGDDVDLSWRIQLKGFTIGFVADAVVRYRHRDDVRALARQMYRYGESEARLYSRYRSHGALRYRVRALLRTPLWLLGHGHLLASRARRGEWVGRAAVYLGRVVGSIRHRVFVVA